MNKTQKLLAIKMQAEMDLAQIQGDVTICEQIYNHTRLKFVQKLNGVDVICYDCLEMQEQQEKSHQRYIESR